MSTMDETEVDPAVCYRHPGRQSWVLCQRCGRTICPECQILAPVGVQCPECVREAGGSVKWTPASGPRPAARKPRASRASSSPAWVQTIGRWMRPGGSTPVISWGLAGVSLLLWLVGFFSSLPIQYLAALPYPFEVWRFVTGAVVYPSSLDFFGVLSFALSMLFWLINAPGAETSMGRQRFVAVVLAGAVAGNAAQMLLGQAGYGLYGALFAIFAAYLIEVWHSPPARMQVLIMLGINLLLVLAFRSLIGEIIVGGLAGAGAFWVLKHYGERARSSERTPYLIIAGALAAIIVITTVRLVIAPVA